MTDHVPLSETERAFWQRSTSLTSSEGWRKAFHRALLDIDDLRGQMRSKEDEERYAAETSVPAVHITRDAALWHIGNSKTGMTVDELEQLGYPHQSASARVHDLMSLNLIRDSGWRRKTRTGRTAIVWMAAKAES